MYTPPDKEVSVTLTPYLYRNVMYTGKDGVVVYVEKGKESPDPSGLLYWGWAADEYGRVGIIDGDYRKYYKKIGPSVTFKVVIPGNFCYSAAQERKWIAGAIRQKVGKLLEEHHVVKIRKINRNSRKTRHKRTIEEVYNSPMYPPLVNENVLRDIADVAGLGSTTKRRFVRFGLLFWEGKRADPTYILEWANRFGRGAEYAVSDKVRLGYLREVDGVETARNRLFETYIHSGMRPDIAEKNVMKVYPKMRRVKRKRLGGRR